MSSAIEGGSAQPGETWTCVKEPGTAGTTAAGGRAGRRKDGIKSSSELFKAKVVTVYPEVPNMCGSEIHTRNSTEDRKGERSRLRGAHVTCDMARCWLSGGP